MTKTEQFEAKVAAIPDAELAEKCDRELSDLCKTRGDSFHMRIPPGVNDTDILFSELIRRFKNRDKWISVEDQLPPKDMFNLPGFSENVIVCDKYGVIKVGYYWFSNETWYVDSEARAVTHWQPLQEPPKEDKK